MNISQLNHSISLLQNRVLSGGIIGSELRISDNGSGMLTLSGNMKITLKVLDLTSFGTPNLLRLMKLTEQAISNKLRGGANGDRVYFYEYNATKNTFTSKSHSYTIRYNFSFTVKLEQISMLSQLAGNDFVLAVVDQIGYRFTDMYGRNFSSGGLAEGSGGPATVSYKSWDKDYHIAVHEFFHTLGLPDLETKGMENRLMFHTGNTGTNVTNNELAIINSFIMRDMRDMTKSTYSNPGYNTRNKLMHFLNKQSNGFVFSKNKLR